MRGGNGCSRLSYIGPSGAASSCYTRRGWRLNDLPRSKSEWTGTRLRQYWKRQRQVRRPIRLTLSRSPTSRIFFQQARRATTAANGYSFSKRYEHGKRGLRGGFEFWANDLDRTYRDEIENYAGPNPEASHPKCRYFLSIPIRGAFCLGNDRAGRIIMAFSTSFGKGSITSMGISITLTRIPWTNAFWVCRPRTLTNGLLYGSGSFIENAIRPE